MDPTKRNARRAPGASVDTVEQTSQQNTADAPAPQAQESVLKDVLGDLFEGFCGPAGRILGEIFAEQSGAGPKKGRGKSQKNLDLIEAAIRIFEEIQPASVRACCYRLFVEGFIPSMEKKHTSRVSKQLTDAREAGDLPWEWVVDETRRAETIPSWKDPAQVMQSAVEQYRKDYWQDHALWLSLADGGSDPSSRERGQGYRDGLAAKWQEHAQAIIRLCSTTPTTMFPSAGLLRSQILRSL